MTSEIRMECDDRGVAVLHIHNPEHRNALNDALIESLVHYFNTLDQDPECRVVVLRGTGGIFCAGRELRDLRRLQQSSLNQIEAVYERLRRLNEAIYFCRKPTVAVLEKYAFGAAATIVSWCDIALAEEGMQLAYPEVHHGITPAPAMMALIRGVSRKAAMDLVLTGRRVDAHEARDMGLVSRVVPASRLEATLGETLASLLRGSPEALRRTKEFVWHCEEAGLRAGMTSAVQSISVGLASPEAGEGIAAFFDKRHPNW